MQSDKVRIASLVGEHNMHRAPTSIRCPPTAPFTWNPAAAGLAGRAFTADTINFTGYVTDVSQPDGTYCQPH